MGRAAAPGLSSLNCSGKLLTTPDSPRSFSRRACAGPGQRRPDLSSLPGGLLRRRDRASARRRLPPHRPAEGRMRTGVKAAELEARDPYELPRPRRRIRRPLRPLGPPCSRWSRLWLRGSPASGSAALRVSHQVLRRFRRGGVEGGRARPAPRRRWMLVDESGNFMSQRRHPRMALIAVRIEHDRLVVSAPEMPSLEVPFLLPDGRPVLTSVWGPRRDPPGGRRGGPLVRRFLA